MNLKFKLGKTYSYSRSRNNELFLGTSSFSESTEELEVGSSCNISIQLSSRVIIPTNLHDLGTYTSCSVHQFTDRSVFLVPLNFSAWKRPHIWSCCSENNLKYFNRIIFFLFFSFSFSPMFKNTITWMYCRLWAGL